MIKAFISFLHSWRSDTPVPQEVRLVFSDKNTAVQALSKYLEETPIPYGTRCHKIMGVRVRFLYEETTTGEVE